MDAYNGHEGIGKLFHPNLPPNEDPVSWTSPDLYPVVIGVRNWSHVNSGGAQDPAAFDDCDVKLATLALQRLAIAADKYHNSSQPFFLGVGYVLLCRIVYCMRVPFFFFFFFFAAPPPPHACFLSLFPTPLMQPRGAAV